MVCTEILCTIYLTASCCLMKFNTVPQYDVGVVLCVVACNGLLWVSYCDCMRVYNVYGLCQGRYGYEYNFKTAQRIKWC